MKKTDNLEEVENIDMKKKMVLLLTCCLVTLALSPVNAYAITQQEALQMTIKAAEERGLSIDDCRGTGGAHPELYIGNTDNKTTVDNNQPSAENNNEEKKHEHKYTANLTTNPTCTTDGVITYTCECGDSYTEAQPKLEHEYKETVTQKATCTLEGEKTFKCSLCEDVYTEVIPKTEHVEGQHKITKQATCTEDGVETIYCKDCTAEMEAIIIPAKGHIASEVVVVKEANLFEDGESIINCTECGDLLETLTVSLTEEERNKQIGLLAGIGIIIGSVGIMVVVKRRNGKRSN